MPVHMLVVERNSLKPLISPRHAICYSVDGADDIFVVEATSAHIPKTQFQEMFIAIGQSIIKGGYKKLVFDMSILQFYQEATFDWYFMVWKERMVLHGLRKHRIILPHNELIRDGVELSRQKVYEVFPQEKYSEFDIQYVESVNEAISDLAQ
jgi:hypothetical protein